MVREIVHLQVGSCGNNIGSKFWEVISDEHGIDFASGLYCGDSNLQLERIEVYYNEVAEGRFVPRAILADMEAGSLDCVRASAIGAIFRPDNFIFGQESSGNNWAKAHYGPGADLANVIVDLARKEAESCEVLQGFQMTHSIGGGSGSGLGVLLCKKIKDLYQDRLQATFTVFPSPKVSDTIVEPLNATLSIAHLVENVDICVNIDNEALYDICTQVLKISNPSFSDLNHIIGFLMTGTTCGFRFPGQLNSDFRKLAVNLICFPRLHFFLTSFAPLTSRLVADYRQVNVSNLTTQCFSSRNMMCACDPTSGKYLTACITYRGDVSSQEVDETLLKVMDKNGQNFVDWIPNNIKSSICDITHKKLNMSAIFLGNSTCIVDMFKRIDDQFTSLFRRRAFVHWYVAAGLQLEDFRESEALVNDLVESFQQFSENTIEFDDVGDDEDDE
jgi:tubulin beta